MSRPHAPEYRQAPEGLALVNYDRDGNPVLQLLTTFVAIIITEIMYTDGLEERLFFEIEATRNGKVKRVTVAAGEFDEMKWVASLGAGWYVTAGHQVVNHARAAIQSLSQQPKLRIVYEHTGWTKHGSKWVYLHGNGAISAPEHGGEIGHGTQGPNRDGPNVEVGKDLDPNRPIVPIPEDDRLLPPLVQLPDVLARFALPIPPKGEDRVAAVEGAFEFLAIGPQRITLPLFAAIWRAAIDQAKFSLFLHGFTGTFKSELSLIAAQFFGADLTVDDLAGWGSTTNSLAGIAFYAKNVLWPVDDFVPFGTEGDAAKTNRQADQLLRAQGNGSGRHRCRGDGSIKPGRAPRGLILSNGEALPTGTSLNARFWPIEIHEGEVFDPSVESDRQRVTAIQRQAKTGVFASAMAAFLEWVAIDYETHRDAMHNFANDLRKDFATEGVHARQVDIASNLFAGLDVFLEFAQEVDAITEKDADGLWEAFHEVAEDALKKHKGTRASDDPAQRFIDLIKSAMQTGKAYLASAEGPPTKEMVGVSAENWGYEVKTIFQKHDGKDTEVAEPKGNDGDDIDLPEQEGKEILVPRGKQIGWIKRDEVYLEPEASLAVAKEYARAVGTPLGGLTQKTLGKRLKAIGVLGNFEKDRNTTKVTINQDRKTLLSIAGVALVECREQIGDYVSIRELDEAREDEFDRQRRKREEEDKKLDATRWAMKKVWKRLVEDA